jgi:VanZ family protein
MANQGDVVTVRQVSRHVPGGDAGLHVVVMGALTFSLALAFAGARFWGHRLGLWGIVALVGLFATLEEWQQMLQPYRRFSLRDLFFSYLGILLGLLGLAFVKWFFARKRGH